MSTNTTNNPKPDGQPPWPPGRARSGGFKEEQIEYLPRTSLVPDPNQPRQRIDPEHVGRLAQEPDRASAR